MSSALHVKLERLLGSHVVSQHGASGGDINTTLLVALADGRRVFVKTHHAPLPGMYLREAEGLRWLAEPNALRVANVLAAAEQDEHGPACLVLELINASRRKPDFDERLGRGLAALHQHAPARFGFAHDNYIAVLPQANAVSSDWATFYAERRLLPQVQLAAAKGRLDTRVRKRFEQLCARLPALIGPSEPPARLHGDLWSGNLLCDEHGAPCLIDPAVYGGHREIDLAMMRLFGGFSERVFDAYDEAYPLAPGHPARVGLYQLYPLLVHVNLFGGHYAASVERTLASYE